MEDNQPIIEAPAWPMALTIAAAAFAAAWAIHGMADCAARQDEADELTQRMEIQRGVIRK